MICKNCGAEIPDGVRFCPNCHTALKDDEGMGGQQNGEEVHSIDDAFESVANDARDAFSRVETGISNEMNDVRSSFNNTPRMFLKTDRSLLLYILLSFVTCGIYPLYFIYRLAEDVNIVCDGDGEETPGIVALILLSIVTCGIYSWYWYYKLGNRLANNAGRYGMVFQENGTTILLWCLFGILLCGVGPYVAMYILIHNTNAICDAYNRKYGLYGGAY